jgi:hypothetical protein
VLEKSILYPSGFNHSRAFTAALKALRHPKSEFFRSVLTKACIFVAW